MKYLSVYLKWDNIDYAVDVKSRIDKVNFAIGQIKWTRTFESLQGAYKQFYREVVMPIYTYALEVYDEEGIVLESHRTHTISMCVVYSDLWSVQFLYCLLLI
eukprot:NODE_61_length_26588_cov_1.146778.p15 type:complete len:102 gc:universal NODE_61_length_26588_cov_1.146778:13176-12871(-)